MIRAILNASDCGAKVCRFRAVTTSSPRQGAARSSSRHLASPVFPNALRWGGETSGSFVLRAALGWILKEHRRKFFCSQTLTTSALAALIVLHTSAPVAATCADVALVLAIDASGSVTDDEFALQQQGYAQAFRSPRVQAVLSDAGIVDIGAVLFSDSEIGLQVLPMMRLQNGSGAEELAVRIEEMPRPLLGNTGIGLAVTAAVKLLDAPGACAHRRLINLSGDGPESMAPRSRTPVSTVTARGLAEDLGITINALAIRTDVPDLDQWYRTRLITGPGAFVIDIEGFESFASAIEQKLLREIGPEPIAALHRAQLP